MRIRGTAVGASAFKRFTCLIHLQIAVADRNRFFPFNRFSYKRIQQVPCVATGCADKVFFPEGDDRDEKQAETIAHEIDLIAAKMTATAARDRLVVFKLLAERQYVKKQKHQSIPPFQIFKCLLIDAHCRIVKADKNDFSDERLRMIFQVGLDGSNSNLGCLA